MLLFFLCVFVCFILAALSSEMIEVIVAGPSQGGVFSHFTKFGKDFLKAIKIF